jgi:hypothetical protein
MGAGRFAIVRRASDHLDIELAGELSERTLVACDAEVCAQLSAAKPGAIRVLIDLAAVETYSIEARDALVALQKHLAGKASQTAFIASSPAGRGLALWASHMTEGQVIKSFAQRADAEGWLLGSPGPTTGVRPVVRARDGERRGRKNSAVG